MRKEVIGIQLEETAKLGTLNDFLVEAGYVWENIRRRRDEMKIKAIYENGIIKPLEKLDLEEKASPTGCVSAKLRLLHKSFKNDNLYLREVITHGQSKKV